MKYLLIIFFLVFSFSDDLICKKTITKKTPIVKKGKRQTKKSKQFIDLEGLDVLGMIDRPQTLYILKKSEINFNDNYAEYDYMGAIIESTYKEPF